MEGIYPPPPSQETNISAVVKGNLDTTQIVVGEFEPCPQAVVGNLTTPPKVVTEEFRHTPPPPLVFI